MLSFGGILYLDAEKIKNKGEDALTFKFDEHGNGYMSVFDGCGGAGSEKHSDLNNEKSAYIASRGCAYYFDFLNQLKDSKDTINEFDLNKKLYSFLKNINEHYPMQSSESTLVDVLPTTLSGAIISNNSNSLSINFIWSGDSRGYIIDCDGISQVTEDDVDSEDAYYNLFDDSIMNNRIHGNSNKEIFQIHSTKIDLKSKSIVICSTDGCYDYFNSPMVFEFFLITMIITSDSFTEAEDKMLDILSEKSGDDCSLIATFYGFEDYTDIKTFLKSRFEFLNNDKENFSESYWNENYKKHYYRFNEMRSGTVAGN